MRHFGYICPDCGETVRGARSVFALRAAAARIACDCGKSELRAEVGDARSTVYVPCGLCGHTGRATCETERMLTGQGVALACPACRQMVCYIGEYYRVESALAELETLALKEKERKESGDGEGDFSDGGVMYEVLSELKEIAARENGITCACGSHTCEVRVNRSSVDLVCTRCGACLRIPAVTDEDLDSLCCHIKLRIPGKEKEND